MAANTLSDKTVRAALKKATAAGKPNTGLESRARLLPSLRQLVARAVRL
jgi:hypothetical protein